MGRLVVCLLELSGSLSDAVGDLFVGIAYRSMVLKSVLSVFDPADVAQDKDLATNFEALLDLMQVRAEGGDKNQILVVDTKNDLGIFNTLAQVCYTHPAVYVVIGANNDDLFKAWNAVDASMSQLTVSRTTKPTKPFLISPLSTGVLVSSEQERRLNDVLSCRLTVLVDKWTLHMKQFSDNLTFADKRICVITPTTAAGESFRASTIALFQAARQLNRLRFVLYDPESVVSMAEASRQAFLEDDEILYWISGGIEIFEYILASRPPRSVRNTVIVVQGFFYSEVALEYVVNKAPDLFSYFMTYMGAIDNNVDSFDQFQQQLTSWQTRGTPSTFMGADSLDLALLYLESITLKLTDPTLGRQSHNVARQVLDQYGGLMGVTTVDNYLDRISGYTIIGLYVSISVLGRLESQWSEVDIQSISSDGTVRYIYPSFMDLNVGLRPTSIPAPPPNTTYVISRRSGVGSRYTLTITNLIGATSNMVYSIPTDGEIARDARTFASFSVTTCSFTVAPQDVSILKNNTLYGVSGPNFASPSDSQSVDTLPCYTLPRAFTENLQPEFNKNNVVRIYIVFPRFKANSSALPWEYAYLSDAKVYNTIPNFQSVLLLLSYNDLFTYYNESSLDLVSLSERFFEDAKKQYRNAVQFQMIFDDESCFIFMASTLFQGIAASNLLRPIFLNSPTVWPTSSLPPPLPSPQEYMDGLALQFYRAAEQLDLISFGDGGKFATPTMRIAASVSYILETLLKDDTVTTPSSSSAISQVIRMRQLVNAGASVPFSTDGPNVPLTVSFLRWIYDTIVVQKRITDSRGKVSFSNAFIDLNFTTETLTWNNVVYNDLCWQSLQRFVETKPETPSAFALQFNKPYVSSLLRFGYVVRAYISNGQSGSDFNKSLEKVPDALNAELGTSSVVDIIRIFYPTDNTLALTGTFITAREIESTTSLQGSVAQKVALLPNVPFTIGASNVRQQQFDHIFDTSSLSNLQQGSPENVASNMSTNRDTGALMQRNAVTRYEISARVDVPTQRILAVISRT